MPRSLLSLDNPDQWGEYYTAGANVGTAGAPTRTAGTATNWFARGIRRSSGLAAFTPIGYSDDGADRILFLGANTSDSYAPDEVRLYLSSTYDGTPKIAHFWTASGYTLGQYNFNLAATSFSVTTPNKVGTNLGSDSLIFQLGAPTGNADGGQFVFRNHRDGVTIQDESRTSSLVDTLTLDKNGNVIARPGKANKGVNLQGVLKSVPNVNVGNSGSGETDLGSCTITSGLWSNTGDGVRARFTVACAANSNAKQLRVYLGTTLLADSGSIAANGGAITIQIAIYRTGATSQQWEATIVGHPSLVTSPAQQSTASETLSGSPVLKITGQGVSSTDVVLRSMLVEFLPANTFNTAL